MAKKKSKKRAGCVSKKVGLKANGRLKKGFRYGKRKGHCIVRAK